VGYGDEDPKLFDPKAFDADQIVGACKAIGIKRIRILPQAVPAAKLKLDVTMIEPPPSGHRVTVKCFYADPELIKVIEFATTESGETDTAKWMTGKE